jgi:hypothetical protein
VSSHRYGVEVAEEVRCSRAQEPHPEWWGPASVERRRFGSAHIGTRSVETPGEAVAQRSKVVRLVVEGWGRRGLGLLQLGWANTAVAGVAAGTPLRGSQEEAAGHMRRTWVEAARHHARQCEPGRKPVSAQRLE